MSDEVARVRASYDAVAERYAAAFADELAGKPLERGLLDAFAELCGAVGGPVADVGCGPGHVTRYLADRGARAFGLDLSPGMVAVARARLPGLEFRTGSLAALGAPDGAWAGAVALYSIIHLQPAHRAGAYRELARVIRTGGWLLVAFHTSSADHPTGSAVHLDTWFDAPVDLTGHFLDPDELSAGLRAAGFEIRARLDREPWSAAEYPSRRCYLLARRS
jgi:SAM-dependent methyltransferase